MEDKQLLQNVGQVTRPGGSSSQLPGHEHAGALGSNLQKVDIDLDSSDSEEQVQRLRQRIKAMRGRKSAVSVHGRGESQDEGIARLINKTEIDLSGSEASIIKSSKPKKSNKKDWISEQRNINHKDSEGMAEAIIEDEYVQKS